MLRRAVRRTKARPGAMAAYGHVGNRGPTHSVVGRAVSAQPKRAGGRAGLSQPGQKSDSGLWGDLSGRFLHAGGLAAKRAQEVELGAPDLGRADDFDLVDDRRVQREDALDALSERNL